MVSLDAGKFFGYNGIGGVVTATPPVRSSLNQVSDESADRGTRRASDQAFGDKSDNFQHLALDPSLFPGFHRASSFLPSF